MRLLLATIACAGFALAGAMSSDSVSELRLRLSRLAAVATHYDDRDAADCAKLACLLESHLGRKGAAIVRSAAGGPVMYAFSSDAASFRTRAQVNVRSPFATAPVQR